MGSGAVTALGMGIVQDEEVHIVSGVPIEKRGIKALHFQFMANELAL